MRNYYLNLTDFERMSIEDITLYFIGQGSVNQCSTVEPPPEVTNLKIAYLTYAIIFEKVPFQVEPWIEMKTSLWELKYSLGIRSKVQIVNNVEWPEFATISYAIDATATTVSQFLGGIDATATTVQNLHYAYEFRIKRN